ncbi:MAG: hypothetical protein J6C98_08215 [Oscillospiraceae bacterium]|nr:hypothetical protein [Oscillospiraceae bacterium]
MQKVISLILVLLLCVSLMGCTAGDNSIEATNNEEKDTDALVGAWYSDFDGIVTIFTETGKMKSYRIECNYNDNPTILSLEESYTLKENNQLETYNPEGDWLFVYDWKIEGDTLTLSETLSNDEIILKKVNKSEQNADLLIGQWKLLSMGYVDSPSYQYWKYDITFYSDGTFISKHKDYYTEEEKTTNSRYTIINDGSTIQMEFTTYSYWTYEFLCDDVMLVTTENSQLLYIAQ